jgi:hypothetical protein
MNIERPFDRSRKIKFPSNFRSYSLFRSNELQTQRV